MSDNKYTFLELLRTNWFIIVFLSSIIVSWTTFNSRINSLEERVDRNSVRIDNQDSSINSMKTALAEINVKLDFIKERLK